MSVYSTASLNYEYVKVRWQEPYVSGAVNRKFFGIFPKGVYSGFVIGPSGLSTRHIQIGPGSVSGGLGTGIAGPGYVSGNYDETVGWSIAVHQSVGGHSSTIAVPPGMDATYNLDATGLDGQRVFVVADVSYSISSQTTASFKLVNAAEIDANPSFVVLGHVDVPANPVTPIDSSHVGYNDTNYPRLTPLSTPAKAGLMPASVWSKLEQFFPWEDLCYADRDPGNNFVIRIAPSQKVANNRRIFTFVDSGISSRFPRDASGNYNGGVNNDQYTNLNIQTGVIGGAHAVSGNTSFSVASVSGTPSSFQAGIIAISPDDTIEVVYGQVHATEADALADANLPEATAANLQVCLFLVKTDGSGAILPLDNNDIFDRRPFLNVGGGGGGVVKVDYDVVTGLTGATVTFTKTYTFGKEAMFFRNGIKMRKVASFTPAVDEYQEVDNGDQSVSITLGTGYEAAVEDVFEMYAFRNSFAGVGLAEKTIHTARGYADGSGTQNCSISTVSSKTRVVVSGFTLQLGLNSGETIGYQTVEVNGQEIERKVTGVNDAVGNVVYEEVNGTTIDIYEITAGPGTQELDADVEVRVRLTSYFVAELDAISTDLIPAADDVHSLGSATRRWKEVHVGPGTVYVGSAGQIKFNETTQKMEFSNDSGATMKNFGSGSGGGGVDLINQLSEDELDLLLTEPADQLMDDFSDSEKGTKVNTAQSLSALRLAGSNTTGTYERVRETSTKVGSVEGVVVAQLQAFAPKNAGLSGSAWTLSGNLTGYFSTSGEVLICKRVTSDGKTVHVFLRKDDDTIARLTPSSVVYNSGPNETVVTLANPDTLDLDLDVTSGNYAANIRLIPMAHEFEARSLTASAYEVMDISNAHGSDSITIPGQAAFLEAAGLTGTVLNHSVKMSPSKQNVVMKVLEKVSGGDQWRFYGSSNSGVTWTLLGSKAFGGTPSEEFGMDFRYASANQLIVADNGKWFSAYIFYNGANFDLKGVYGDLASPGVTDTPAQSGGAPGGTIGTVAVGNLMATASEDVCWAVAGDTTDLSMVGVFMQQFGSNYHAIFYSNGGATHFASKVNLLSASADIRGNAIMTGAAGSRRFWFAGYYSIGANSNMGYLVETDNFQNALNVSGSAGVTSLGDRVIDDLALHNNKLAFIMNSSNNKYFRYIDNATTGTPSGLSTEQQINPIGATADAFLGTPNNGGTNGANFARHANNRIYLNNNRLLYSHDWYNSDAIRRTYIHEIRDITSYQGAHINATVSNTTANLRNASGQTQTGQTFTANSSRFRCAAFRMWQVGIIADGYELTCEIQTTSGGLPTGTVVASAVNSYNPRNLTKSTAGQNVFFNFDSPSLTNGVVYALVLKSTIPISGSNYVAMSAESSGTFAGGQHCNYNGTIWSAPGSDLYFQIWGEWIYDLSHEARAATATDYWVEIWNQEATLSAVDSNVVRMAHRRVFSNTVNLRTQSGHVWTSLITLGSAGVASTFTAPAQIGHASFDKNLVFGTNFSTSTGWLDRTTGVLDTTRQVEDRSGALIPYEGSVGLDAADFVADSSFQSGFCLDLNGSDERLYYTAYDMHNLHFQAPFIIEAEIKLTTNAVGQKTIVSKYANSTNYGWIFSTCVVDIGDLYFVAVNSAGSVIAQTRAVASTLAANTYYVVRAVYDGLGGPVKLFISSTGPSGTFTEASYAVSVSFASGNTSTPTQLRIGNHFDGSETGHFNGKIGYIKMAKMITSFVYSGYKDQRPMVGLINLGSKVFAETKGGRVVTADTNSSFDEAGMIDPNGSSTSIVDSNDIYLFYSKELANTKGQAMHLKATMNRASATDTVTALRGLNFKYGK